MLLIAILFEKEKNILFLTVQISTEKEAQAL